MSDTTQRIALERAIVRALIRHLRDKGFVTHRVNDGEEMVSCLDSEEKAMDAVFSVDESSLRFVPMSCSALKPKQRDNYEHGVLLVCGNGEDIISDWNYNEGDKDGFNAAMDAFDVEKIAGTLHESSEHYRKLLADFEERTKVMAKSLREKPSKKTLEQIAEWLDIMQSRARPR
jgi:hypothetical protein